MDRLRRLAQVRLLDAGAIVLIFLFLYKWAVFLPARWSDFDFNGFYVCGRTLLDGKNPYTTSVEALSHAMGFRFYAYPPTAGYPPPFLWMFAALAALPPRAAFAIWVAVELISLAAILWLTRWLLRGRLSSRGWLFVVALTITSQCVLYHLLFSQAQLLLAALVLAGYAAQRAGRHGWACIAVATAGILKFYPFVLLPWFVWSGNGGVRGRWRRLLGSTAFIVAAVALTGPGLWRDFFRYGLTAALEGAVGRTFHFSLPALVINLGYLHYNLHPPEEAAQWWQTVGALVSGGVLAAGYAVCGSSRRDPEAQFCLLCAVMLMGTLSVQGNYFVFLVFPLTVVAARIAARLSVAGVISFILLLLAFNCLHPPDSTIFGAHKVLYLLASDVPLYGLFALAAFFWAELRGACARYPIDNEGLSPRAPVGDD
jgi:hypothetical protein